MKHILNFLKDARENRRLYFKYSINEIDHANVNILKYIGIITLIVILIFIGITPIIFPTWRATVHYLLFIGVMVIFTFITKIFNNSKYCRHNIIKLMYISFLTVVIIFLVLLDTVPYPEAPAAFIGIFLASSPILFIISEQEMIVYQILSLVIFSIAVKSMKSQEIVNTDIFNAVVGFVVGIIIYYVVMALRIEDNVQKSTYRISSEIDSLTKIPNRFTCKKKIDAYLSVKSSDTTCALLVLDIDNFKNVNDKLGHSCGDEVLIAVADILKKVFRTSDIYGRFGGDEFIVFLRDIPNNALIKNKCIEINDKMKDIMQDIIKGQFTLSCSIGVAVLVSYEATLEELFKVADDALYEAKAFGKATYVQHEFERISLNENEKPVMVIVDDSVIDRESIAMQFYDQYQIEQFENGNEALSFINQNSTHISIVLLDMIMPKINGFEVLKYMKSRPKTSWIPVIAMSSDINTEEKALSYGASDMIVKPIVPPVVKIRVSNVMKNSKEHL